MPLLAVTQLQQYMELTRQKQLKCQDTATHLTNLVSRRQMSLTWSNNQLYWFHGCMLWLQSTMLFQDGMPPAAVGTKKQESQQQHRNCGLPPTPTTDAIEQDVYRAHFQVAQWYSAMSVDPPLVNAVDYGWEADEANKCFIPPNMVEAPEQILKQVKCGCKGANCGCMGHQVPCTTVPVVVVVSAWILLTQRTLMRQSI